MSEPSRIPRIEEGLIALLAEWEPKSVRVPRGHIIDDNLKIYCRVSIKNRGRPNGAGVMLVLASIDVVPEQRGQGYMRELLAFMERLATNSPIVEGLYVEAVNNDELIPPLMRRGFQVNRETDPMGNGWGADWFKLLPSPVTAVA